MRLNSIADDVGQIRNAEWLECTFLFALAASLALGIKRVKNGRRQRSLRQKVKCVGPEAGMLKTLFFPIWRGRETQASWRECFCAVQVLFKTGRGMSTKQNGLCKSVCCSSHKLSVRQGFYFCQW